MSPFFKLTWSHPVFVLRHRLPDLFVHPVLRPLQHSDGVQQAVGGLQKTPAGSGGVVAVFGDMDSAPLIGLE